MNLINEIIFEIKNEAKSIRFHVPAGSSYQECYDALVQFMKKVMEMSQSAEQQQAPSLQQEAPAEQQEAPVEILATPEVAEASQPVA